MQYFFFIKSRFKCSFLFYVTLLVPLNFISNRNNRSCYLLHREKPLNSYKENYRINIQKILVEIHLSFKQSSV